MNRTDLQATNSSNRDMDSVRDLLFGSPADLPTSTPIQEQSSAPFDSPFEEDFDDDEELDAKLSALENRLKGFESLLLGEAEAAPSERLTTPEQLREELQSLAAQISSIPDDGTRASLGHFLIELGLNVQPGK